MIRVIKDGDNHKKGNAQCPQCGEKVLIERYWGDPPKCPDCGVPYSTITHPVKYIG